MLSPERTPFCKFFGLGILEELVRVQWKICSAAQRNEVKQFVISTVFALADAPPSPSTAMLVPKANKTLVHVLRQEWPENWPTFLGELVASCERSDAARANNMAILLLLSEEVFDNFGSLTSAKLAAMRRQFAADFPAVWSVIKAILSSGTASLETMRGALSVLGRFLSWAPLEAVLDEELLHRIVTVFLPTPELRVPALSCLAELAEISSQAIPARISPAFAQTFKTAVEVIAQTCSARQASEAGTYAEAFAAGDEHAEREVLHTGRLIMGALRNHSAAIEALPDAKALIPEALLHLVAMTLIGAEARGLFSSLVDFWAWLGQSLLTSSSSSGGAMLASSLLGAHSAHPRVALYAPTLHFAREALIHTMAKPEEVLLVEDPDTGDIVREHMKNVDVIALHKAMRMSLSLLATLNVKDTEELLQAALERQMDPAQFSWNGVNTLSWAVGAISGVMTQDAERNFLVLVIRNLLLLVKVKDQTSDRAVVASCIMYVCAQYPRFLRDHWEFLKTVVRKLCEFLHEPHPGVKDMAVDTLTTICRHCKARFLRAIASDPQPFIEELIAQTLAHTADLTVQQQHGYYHALAIVIAAETTPDRQFQLLSFLLTPPKGEWDAIIAEANRDASTLYDPTRCDRIAAVLRCFTVVCEALGPAFAPILATVYRSFLDVYHAQSTEVGRRIQEAEAAGQSIVGHLSIRRMRACKRQTLRLLSEFISSLTSMADFPDDMLAPLIERVLGDFVVNVPLSRDPEVLTLFASTARKAQDAFARYVPGIFDLVFKQTLDMLSGDFDSNPEVREAFFCFARALTHSCFSAVLALTAEQTELFVQSLFFGIRHSTRGVRDDALRALMELVTNWEHSSTDFHTRRNAFFQTYYFRMLQAVLVVLTDSSHRPAFKLHAALLRALLALGVSDTVPTIWAGNPLLPQPPAGCTNAQYIMQFMTSSLAGHFPHIAEGHQRQFVSTLLSLSPAHIPASSGSFEQALLDYLVSSHEYCIDEAKELQASADDMVVAQS
jgi:exportin-1